MLVMRLLAAMPVTNNRVAFTDRTMAYDDLVAVVGPADSKPLQPGRHWDKEDRYLKGASLSDVDPPKISAGCEAPPPEEIQLKENIASYRQPRRSASAFWPVISLLVAIEPSAPVRKGDFPAM